MVGLYRKKSLAASWSPPSLGRPCPLLSRTWVWGGEGLTQNTVVDALGRGMQSKPEPAGKAGWLRAHRV